MSAPWLAQTPLQQAPLKVLQITSTLYQFQFLVLPRESLCVMVVVVEGSNFRGKE